MNVYTVTPSGTREGIPITDEVVHVGESGRGRKLTRVPIPPGGIVENGRLVSAPLRAGEVAVVLIQDHSGFRGSWHARGVPSPELAAEWRQMRAAHEAAVAAVIEAAVIPAEVASLARQARQVVGERESAAWATFDTALAAHGWAAPTNAAKAALEEAQAAASAADAVVKAAEAAVEAARMATWAKSGHAPSPCPVCEAVRARVNAALPAWREIACGLAAQGDAGRMGGGPVYLVALRAGAAAELVRCGRLYGAPAVLRLEADAAGVRVVDVAAEAAAASAADSW